MPETRKAVASFKASCTSPSEEWDALSTKAAGAAAMPRIVDVKGGAWTPPEAWMAFASKQAAATAAAERAEEAAATAAAAVVVEEDAAVAAAAGREALEAKKQAAFAADAYAFGILSWEVGLSVWLLCFVEGGRFACVPSPCFFQNSS